MHQVSSTGCTAAADSTWASRPVADNVTTVTSVCAYGNANARRNAKPSTSTMGIVSEAVAGYSESSSRAKVVK